MRCTVSKILKFLPKFGYNLSVQSAVFHFFSPFLTLLTCMVFLDSVSRTSKFSTPWTSSFKVAPMTALPPPWCRLYQACRFCSRCWDLQRPHSSPYKPHTSRVPNFIFEFLTLEDGTNRLSLNVVRNYHYSLRNNREERWNYEIKNPSYVLNLLLFGSFILPPGASASLVLSILPQLRYRHTERIQIFCCHVGCVIILCLNKFCAVGGCVLQFGQLAGVVYCASRIAVRTLLKN